MVKTFAVMNALAHGGISVKLVKKTIISRTPGNVTQELGHN
ncbi:MAG TPA: hypothetical protein VH500_21580 [Nitrososphaeraceae archaeon]|jgi:hypothetical protein